jgi:hypothetical protein
MYRDETSPTGDFYVCRFTPGGSPEADYGRHVDAMSEMVRRSRGKPKPGAVIIIQDPGYPAPDAKVRERVVEMSDAPGFNLITAIVTTNTLIRGVITALNWVRKKRGEEQVFASGDHALRWLERSLGEELKAMRSALQRISG